MKKIQRPLAFALKVFPAAVGLLLLSLLSIVLLGRIERTVEASGSVRVHHYQIARTPVAGRVAEVLAHPGQRVQAGEPLYRLEDPEHRRQLAQARQSLDAITLDLERLRAESSLRGDLLDRLELDRREASKWQGERDAQLATSRRREAELELESLGRRLEQTQELQGHGLVSDSAVLDARQAVEAAEERLAQRRIEEDQASASRGVIELERRLLEGEHQRRRLDAGAEQRRLESEARLWRGELERLQLRSELYLVEAELDGVVISEPVTDLIARQLAPGDELARIIDVESIHFVSRIPEEAVVQVRQGQAAAVEMVGLPKQRFQVFSGEVRRVDLRPQLDAAGTPVYPVEIQLERPWIELGSEAFYLRGGMRGKARIAYRHEMPLVRVMYEFLTGAPALPQSPAEQSPGEHSEPAPDQPEEEAVARVDEALSSPF